MPCTPQRSAVAPGPAVRSQAVPGEIRTSWDRRAPHHRAVGGPPARRRRSVLGPLPGRARGQRRWGVARACRTWCRRPVARRYSREGPRSRPRQPRGAARRTGHGGRPGGPGALVLAARPGRAIGSQHRRAPPRVSPGPRRAPAGPSPPPRPGRTGRSGPTSDPGCTAPAAVRSAALPQPASPDPRPGNRSDSAATGSASGPAAPHCRRDYRLGRRSIPGPPHDSTATGEPSAPAFPGRRRPPPAPSPV